MEGGDYVTLLPMLGRAIDSSLSSWESHLDSLSQQPSFESITADRAKDTVTKVKALEHILQTMPSRHAALVRSYCDPELEVVEVPEHCSNLLAELQEGGSQVDLDNWFNNVVAGKKFVANVVQLEKDIWYEEQARLQELRRLKAIHVGLMAVREDGELGLKEVTALFEAMEAVGISLLGAEGTPIQNGAGTGKPSTS